MTPSSKVHRWPCHHHFPAAGDTARWIFSPRAAKRADGSPTQRPPSTLEPVSDTGGHRPMMLQEKNPGHDRRPAENDDRDHATGERQPRRRPDRICHSNQEPDDYKQNASGRFPAQWRQCQDHKQQAHAHSRRRHKRRRVPRQERIAISICAETSTSASTRLRFPRPRSSTVRLPKC